MPQQTHLLGFQVDIQEGEGATTLLILTDTATPQQYILPMPNEMAQALGKKLTAPDIFVPPTKKIIAP